MIVEVRSPRWDVGFFPCRRCGALLHADAALSTGDAVECDRDGRGLGVHTERRCALLAGAIGMALETECPECGPVAVQEAVRVPDTGGIAVYEMASPVVNIPMPSYIFAHFVPAPAERVAPSPMMADVVWGLWHRWEVDGPSYRQTMEPGAGWPAEVPWHWSGERGWT